MGKALEDPERPFVKAPFWAAQRSRDKIGVITNLLEKWIPSSSAAAWRLPS